MLRRDWLEAKLQEAVVEPVAADEPATEENADEPATEENAGNPEAVADEEPAADSTEENAEEAVADEKEEL